MARLNRLVIPGFPHMLLQRVRTGCVAFQDQEDADVLIRAIHEAARQTQLEVHAFVLLPDRWMVLATPPAAQAISLTMQTIGRKYVRHVNRRHGLRGGLWASRFSSTVVDASSWVLPCMVFLDLAAVRAGLVQEPKHFLNGTHRHYAGLQHDRQLMAPPAFWSLGNTPFAREAAYAELVRTGLSQVQVHAIDDALQHGWALGESDFIDHLQMQTERRLRPRPRGRPRRSGLPRPE
jgi:putative transposase